MSEQCMRSCGSGSVNIRAWPIVLGAFIYVIVLGARVTSAESLPAPAFGPYAITARIGVGGMGEVYRATDTNLKRSVAIKGPPGSSADHRLSQAGRTRPCEKRLNQADRVRNASC